MTVLAHVVLWDQRPVIGDGDGWDAFVGDGEQVVACCKINSIYRCECRDWHYQVSPDLCAHLRAALGVTA